MDDAERASSAARRWVKRNFPYMVFAFALVIFLFPRVSPWEGLNHNLQVFSRLSEWALRKVEHLFRDYGYYVVFFGVLLENSMFLGLLVPGAIILILAGLAAENGTINIAYVFALAITATIIGDSISYLIGRLGWTKFIERTGMAGAIERVRAPMESNSVWIILGYHLAGYSRAVGPLAAGIFHIPYRRWAPLDYTGGAIWVFVYTGVGVVLGLFGVEFGDTKRMVNLLEWFFLGVFAVAVILTFAGAARGRSGGDDEPPSTGSGRRRATVIIPVDDGG